MSDQTAWLIERADPLNPGCIMPGHFLGIAGWYAGPGNAGGKLAWLSSAHDALRFARRQDAEMFIGWAMLSYDALPHGQTLPGLRSGDLRAIATDHLWCDAAL